MCPPEKLRDDHLAMGSEPPRHFEQAEAFDSSAPRSPKRRISDTFLAVRDFAVDLWEAGKETRDGPADDAVNHT